MIVSATSIDSDELRTMAESSDVCVIGAGPAGLAIGLELSRLGANVMLLESGPVGGSRRAESLSIGENAGFLTFPLHEMRKRGLGGTSRAWASNLARLEPCDFETKSWIPDSGWPIDFDTVDQWVDPALRRLGTNCTVTAHEEAEARWRNGPLFQTGALDVRAIAATDTGDVGRAWRNEIESDRQLHVVTDLHVTRLRCAPGGESIRSLDVRVQRSSRSIEALELAVGHVVIATGGVEAPRLLLASTDRCHPYGLGNHGGHLGQWYQDHPFAWCGRFEATEPDAVDELLFPAGEGRGEEALGPLMRLPAAEVNASKGVTCGVFVLAHRPWMASEEFHRPAMTAFRRTKRAVRAGHLPVDAVRDARHMALGMGELVRLERARRSPVPDQHVVRLQIESPPRWESHLRLSDRVDRFGIPRAVIDWQVGDTERASAQQLLQTFADAVDTSGLGRFCPVPSRPDGWPMTIEPGYHPSGTTRMSREPEDGVVDTDTKVHGIDNLWVNSSSVFPTAGYANPTLTVVALGLRLADHLRQLG